MILKQIVIDIHITSIEIFKLELNYSTFSKVPLSAEFFERKLIN